MQMLLVRTVIAAVIIGVVSEIAHRSPRMGAVLLTLPVVSIIAIMMTWFRDHDLQNLSQLSRETLILVPLGLPFFIPLAFADRLGLNFWSALGAGVFLATISKVGLRRLIPPTLAPPANSPVCVLLLIGCCRSSHANQMFFGLSASLLRSTSAQ